MNIKSYLRAHPLRYTNIFRSLKHLFGYNPTEENFRKVMEYIRGVNLSGNYLEFGVYEGYSFTVAYHFANLYGLKDMKFYAFDSFKGIPGLEDKDKKTIPSFKKGNYACSLKRFKENLINKKVKLNKVFFVEGFYKDTLNDDLRNKLKLEKIAVVLIDSDLYSSATFVLDFIKDYLQDGSVIIFDNWFCGEEKRAFEKWLKKNPNIKAEEFSKYDWRGISFIINLKNEKK